MDLKVKIGLGLNPKSQLDNNFKVEEIDADQLNY